MIHATHVDTVQPFTRFHESKPSFVSLIDLILSTLVTHENETYEVEGCRSVGGRSLTAESRGTLSSGEGVTQSTQGRPPPPSSRPLSHSVSPLCKKSPWRLTDQESEPYTYYRGSVTEFTVKSEKFSSFRCEIQAT